LGEFEVLNYIVTFFLLAVLASILGFGSLAGTFSEIAKVLAIIFLVLFLLSLIRHLMTGKTPPSV